MHRFERSSENVTMTAKITSKDVLTCLNLLGYENINAQQLKEFTQDLKKLIKYEERKRSTEDVHSDSEHIPDGTSDYLPSKHGKRKDYKATDSPSSEVQEPDKFTVLYSHATIASEAKSVPKKENVISLQIKKSKCHHHCTQHQENILPESTVNKNDASKDLQEDTKNLHLTEKVKRVNSDHDSRKSIKPKSSFIRPQIHVHNKSDPVALYHYYKAEWDKYKIPGEDQRNDLRWVIRERMSSGPRI